MAKNYSLEISVLAEALLSSGNILRNYWSKGLATKGVKNKGKNGGQATDLVTETDIKSGDNMEKVIRKKFPNSWIGREENGGGNKNKWKDTNNAWVMDELDGTPNWVSDIPELVAISLGYLDKGNMVLAGVYFPFSYGAPLYIAEKGKGVVRKDKFREKKVNIKSGNIKLVKNLKSAIGEYFRGGHPTPKLREMAVKTWEVLSNNLWMTRHYGSGVLGLIKVAEGNMHLAVKIATSTPGDHAPACFILQEAGGIVTDIYGRPWSLDMGTIVASIDVRLHKQLLRMLKPTLKYLPKEFRGYRTDGNFANLPKILRNLQSPHRRKIS